MNHTFGYHSTQIHMCTPEIVYVCSRYEIRGGNFNILKTIVGLKGNGCFATVSQGAIGTSDGS